MDEKIINEEILNSLLLTSPTKSELDLVLSYKGDLNLLAEPDKYFLKVFVFPSLKLRLNSWNYKNSLIKIINEISK